MSATSRKRSIDAANLSIVSEGDISEATLDESTAGKRMLLDTSIEKENKIQIPLAVPEPDFSDNDVKIALEETGKTISKTRVNARLRRSISVPNLLDPDGQKVATTQQRRATTTLVPPLEESKDTSLSNWDSFDTTRLHELTSVRIAKPFSNKECSVCNANIKFGTTCSRCSICRLSFHTNCIQSIPVPCLPRKETPKSTSLKGRLRLGDFCPDFRPMIPHLLGHCAVFLERSEIPADLYANFGNEALATELLSNFKRKKNVPKLTDYDSKTIAGCVKKFLLEIRDSLIPTSDASYFVEALDKEDSSNALLQLIKGLSTAHRDSLIYMVRHWKRLGELSYNGSIRLDDVSRTMGPVVFGVGRSASNITEEDASKCLQSILDIPAELINELLVEENSSSLLRKSSQQSNDFVRLTSSSNLIN